MIRVMVIQECTSAYAIWLQLKQESLDSGHEKEIIAYKNVNVRLIKLLKLGYIIEIAPHAYTQHGRRDYKVTMKGFELLLPYIMGHPEDVKNINRYILKFDLDKRLFLELLIDKFYSGLDTLYVILLTTLTPKIDDSIWNLDVVESINQLLRNIKKLKEAFPKSSSKPIFRKEGEEPISLNRASTIPTHESNKILEDKKESTSGVQGTIKHITGRKKKPT